MEINKNIKLFLGIVLYLTLSKSFAVLVTNDPMTITHQVNVQPIIVSDTDGSNTATFFGDSGQQSVIESIVDTIWAQAGIDVQFLTATNWNDSFANSGNPGNNNPRPTSDLGSVVNDGISAGVTHSDPNIINMFFVNIPAGFSALGGNTAAGFAFVGGNGITQYVGSNLLSFNAGQEVIATVVAHEIGHNLGLPHSNLLGYSEGTENLMWSSNEITGERIGQRINLPQKTTALASNFSVEIVPIPIPAAVWLFGSAVIGLFGVKSRFRVTV